MRIIITSRARMMVVAALVFMPRTLPAATWNNAAGGLWETPGNWTSSVVPTTNETVTINLDGSYTVLITNSTADLFPSTMTINNLTMGNGAADTMHLVINYTNSLVALTLTNTGVNAMTLGGGGSQPVLEILGGTVVLNGGIKIGNAAGASAVVSLQGGTLVANGTGANGTLGLGSVAGATGTLYVTGGSLYMTNASGTFGVAHNGLVRGSLIVSNGLVATAGGVFTVARSGGRGDLLVYGGEVKLDSSVSVSDTLGSTGTIVVAGGKIVATNMTGTGSSFFTLGGDDLGTMVVSNQGVFSVNRLRVGSTNAAAMGRLLVANGGMLEMIGANSMIALTNAANSASSGSISNVNGTYQFTTNNPTITAHKAGNIAITDGTISFRDVSSGLNLTNNWKGSGLTNMAFNGFNALRLNNSTATNTLAGGYAFDKFTGNATNYYRLEMINGTTAVTGNGITITNAGSLLASNTFATFGGVVTNYTAGFHLASSTITGLNGFVWMSGSAATATLGAVNFSANTTNRLNSGTITWFQSSNATQAVNGVITGSGNLVKDGTGLLTLGAINSFTGSTTVTNGTLVAGTANVLTNSSGLNIGLISGSSTGRFDLAGFNQTIRSLAGNGFVTNSSPTIAALTVSNTSAGTYAGVISANNRLVMAGSSVLTLTGANTYQSGTTVSNGTLRLGAANAFPNATALRVDGGVFDQNGYAITVSTLNGNGGVISNAGLTVNSGGTYAGVIAGTGALANNGGVLALNGANTYTGDTDINGGTLRVNGKLASPIVNVNIGGTLGGTGVIAGAVIIYNGGTFSPGNSVGTNTVGALTMQAASSYNWEFKTAAPYASDYTIVTNSSGLTINGGDFYLYQESTLTPFQVGGLYKLIEYNGALGGAGVGTLTWQNNSGLSYEFGTATAASTNFVTLLIGGGTAGWDGQATGGGSSGNSYWTNALNWGSDSAPTNYSRLAFNTFNRLISTNNFAADTPFAGMVFSNGAGAFVLHGNRIAVAGSIVNNSALQQTIRLPLLLDNIDLVVNASSGNLEIAGAIASSGGSYGLIKNGSRTLILSGNDTYTGATVVNAGTLVVNGSLASGNGLTLANNTWLGGTGTIGRVISGSGTIAPGLSPGILTVNQLNPSANMNFNFEFTSLGSPDYAQPGASLNDVLRITNATPFTVALGMSNTVNLYVNAPLVVGQTNVFRGGFYTDIGGAFDTWITNANFNVFGAGVGALEYVTTVPTNAFGIGGYVMEFGVMGEAIVTVVPEPNVLLLWLAGMTTFWAARHRRRQRR